MWTHRGDARQRGAAAADFGYRMVPPETGSLASGQEGIGRLAELAAHRRRGRRGGRGRAGPPARRRRAARRSSTAPATSTSTGRHDRRERRRHRGGHRPRAVHRQPEHRQDGRRDRRGGPRARRARDDRRGPRRGPAPAGPPSSSAPSRPRPCATPSLDAGHRPAADALVMAAAVADFRPAPPRTDEAHPRRRPEPRARAHRGHPRRGRRAGRHARAPTRHRRVRRGDRLLDRAPDKLRRKGADLLVANDVSEAGSGFGTETNRVVDPRRRRVARRACRCSPSARSRTGCWTGSRAAGRARDGVDERGPAGRTGTPAQTGPMSTET